MTERSVLWEERTWREIEAEDRSRAVAILPIGAVEAHGPHLALATDRVIAEAMAAAAARRLRDDDVPAYVLPALVYTAAPFAEGFPGTVSVRGETVTELVVDVGRALAAQSVGNLALANAHFDPENLASLHRAVDRLRSAGAPRVVFPDVTRKPWALRLGEEFASGACHAGRYEGSIVLARRPELVRDEIRRRLAPFPESLSRAIAAGKSSFEEVGGDEAYFGDPAAATAEEGERTIALLGEILSEAVLQELGSGSS